MSTTDHLTKIINELDDMRERELPRGTVVQTETTLGVAPAHLNVIRRNAEALAAQLAAAVADRDFEHAELNRMTRSWEQAQAALSAERARVARFEVALMAEVNRNRRMHQLVPMTRAQVREYHRLNPDDLPDEEATR